MPDPLLIKYPVDICDRWLSTVLDRDVTITSIERIGTGQMSQSNRVSFSSSTPGVTSVIVKQASDDEQSRATGVGMGAYSREVAFYDTLASRIVGPLPACHFAAYDSAEGWFTLVLEDVADAAVGDQIAGCTVAEAHQAMRELARVHAPVFNDLAVGTAKFLNQPNPLNGDLLTALLPGFLERYADRISPEHAAVCSTFVPAADAWSADSRPPLGLVHGDYRLDNLLFGEDGCTVVDWQTVTWGQVMTDAAYFIGGALPPEERREYEESLVRTYYDGLVELGVSNFGWEQCWAEYRRQSFHGLLMAIVASMVVVRTERGDDMFMTWLARVAQQVLDLDALELLPAPAAKPVALRPEPADDSDRHAPGPEPLWNESWYFDVVNAAADIGVYIRLGRLPNQDCSVYTVAIVGPGRPAVMLVDVEAPLPDTDDNTQFIRTEMLRAQQHCVEPLTTFQVTAEGVARSHTDESAPLRDEAGEPVDIAVDLTWQTDGTPYLWRRSTRYEIPCRVTGTVRVGDEVIAIDGPGQRDHSWGARDWWADDWMWSAFHLSDGTHTHAVTIPEIPGFAVGYAQRDGAVTEWESGTSTATSADSGLITSAQITTAAQLTTGRDELTLDVRPLAFGALRLVAPDGRVTHFPRAMARVTSADGRDGLGWIEWNRNQH